MNHDWRIKRLGDICHSDLGKTLNQSKDTGKLYPYLCAVNIQWDKIDLTTLKQTRFEEDETERFSVRKGDLLVCEGGDIGRAAIWNEDEPMRYQNALHRIRFDGSMLPRFCLYYLRSLKNQGVLDSQYGKGVTIKHLVKSSLLSIPIPVPSIKDQQHIVSELDLLTGIIDAKKKQLRDLDALAQSIFYEMFGDSEYAHIKLAELCASSDDIKCGPFGTQLSKDEFQKTGVAVWGIPQINSNFVVPPADYISEDKAKSLEAYSLIPGDIVMSRKGNIGQSAVFPEKFRPGVLHSDALRIRLRSDLANVHYYVYQFHLSPFIKHQLMLIGHGAIMPGLNVTKLKGIDVEVPPIDMQNKFGRRVVDIEERKKEIISSITTVKDLLDSRMDRYFTY